MASILYVDFGMNGQYLARGEREPFLMLPHFFWNLWLLPFLIAPNLIDAYRRSKMWYFVTDKRVVILSRVLGRRKESWLDYRTLSNIALDLHADGSGNILFGSAMSFGVLQRTFPRFERIQNAQTVYETILAAQASSAEKTPLVRRLG